MSIVGVYRLPVAILWAAILLPTNAWAPLTTRSRIIRTFPRKRLETGWNCRKTTPTTPIRMVIDYNDPVVAQEFTLVQPMTDQEVKDELMKSGIFPPASMKEMDAKLMLVEMRMRKQGNMPEKQGQPSTFSSRFEEALWTKPAFSDFYNTLKSKGDYHAMNVVAEYVNDPQTAKARYDHSYRAILGKVDAALKKKTSAAAIGSQAQAVPLANGVEMPVLSLGTAHVVTQPNNKDPKIPANFMGFRPDQVGRQMQLALESGIRSFESARIYRSHRIMGQVLGEWFRTGQLQRHEVFLTTKVFHGSAVQVATKNSHMWQMDDLTPEEVTTRVEEEIEEALADLQVGHIDLLLLHWPAASRRPDSGDNSKEADENRKRRLAAWKVLENYYEKGWLRAIGVSNFSEHHLKQLKEDGATITPMVNQIESSFYVQYSNIFNYCKQEGIVCQAFSPFRRGTMLEPTSEKLLEDIARRYSKNVGQMALRYLIQSGYVVVFGSTSAGRMYGNQNIFDFRLTEEDMATLRKLSRPDGNWGLMTPYEID